MNKSTNIDRNNTSNLNLVLNAGDVRIQTFQFASYIADTKKGTSIVFEKLKSKKNTM